MYNDFQAESVLLSEDMKRKREDVIISKEKDYKVLQAVPGKAGKTVAEDLRKGFNLRF